MFFLDSWFYFSGQRATVLGVGKQFLFFSGGVAGSQKKIATAGIRT